MANKNPKKFTKRLVLKITPEQELAWKELDKDSKTNIINFMRETINNTKINHKFKNYLNIPLSTEETNHLNLMSNNRKIQIVSNIKKGILNCKINHEDEGTTPSIEVATPSSINHNEVTTPQHEGTTPSKEENLIKLQEFADEKIDINLLIEGVLK